MQSCEKCGITIRGAKSKCPLCGNELTGTPAPETAGFPALHDKVSKWSVLKVSAFCFFVLEVLMMLVQYISGGRLMWPVVVMVLAPVGLADLFLAFFYRHNVLKLISVQVYVGMLLAVMIDRNIAGWHKWSVSWLLPFGFVGLAITIICIGCGLRLKLIEYITYLAVAVIASMTQLLLIRQGLNPHPLPAVISMSVMAVLGVAGMLFFFRELRSAASRTFHM
ncbi:MAG: hypothetical protein IJI10_08920 [Eubacterium sp.]|nr:hypothetical protein [Eubacterium sp.]